MTTEVQKKTVKVEEPIILRPPCRKRKFVVKATATVKKGN